MRVIPFGSGEGRFGRFRVAVVGTSHRRARGSLSGIRWRMMSGGEGRRADSSKSAADARRWTVGRGMERMRIGIAVSRSAPPYFGDMPTARLVSPERFSAEGQIYAREEARRVVSKTKEPMSGRGGAWAAYAPDGGRREPVSRVCGEASFGDAPAPGASA